MGLLLICGTALSYVTVETSRFLHNFQMCTNTAEAWSGLDSALTQMQPELLYALGKRFLHLVEHLDLILPGGQ